jgi:predicted nucleotidyltransferase
MKTLETELLGEAIDRIVNRVQPERIYLYGSHAYGQPHDDSDIDLLVITRDTSSPARQQVVAMYSALRGLLLPIEIKVDTRDEFERRSHWISSLERVVAEKGRIVYESAI